LEITKIGVVGAGSWGTALAQLLAEKGFLIDLWAYEPEVKEQILSFHENRLFLPGIILSRNLNATNDLEVAVVDKDLILVVVPSHVMGQTARNMAPHILPEATIVTASKGIENKTFRSMSDILMETLPRMSTGRMCVLSGPSFAKEVARHTPTVVTVASRDLDTAVRVQRIFSTPAFRAYTSDDVVGVELGGAVKNVIAIASGILEGLGLGYNTRAALITRGMTEIRRLGLALGANPRTFTGPAGIGDLILTCTADMSRNYTVGKKIGQGMSLSAILADMRMVAEGVKTAESVYHFSRKLGVEMPISNEIYHILYSGREPKTAIRSLMTRDLKHELDEQ
jgi:glycerol-3-phosphate dehydrogenase (NAD(P)+)